MATADIKVTIKARVTSYLVSCAHTMGWIKGFTAGCLKGDPSLVAVGLVLGTLLGIAIGVLR